MANHPNRSRNSAAKNPTPKEIKKARLAAGLSQAAAAELIYSTLRSWQNWEAEEGAISTGGFSTHRRMHPGLWELFLIKSAKLREQDGNQ